MLGVLTLLAIGQAYFLAPQGRQVSYSEFKGLVRGGQVAEVAVGDTIIHGTLKKAEDGATAFTTTRIEDPKLVEELDQAQVKYFGRDRQPLAARDHRLDPALRVDYSRRGRSSRGGSAAPKAA